MDKRVSRQITATQAACPAFVSSVQPARQPPHCARSAVRLICNLP